MNNGCVLDGFVCAESGRRWRLVVALREQARAAAGPAKAHYEALVSKYGRLALGLPDARHPEER